MRGGVSLAAALAIPIEGFPDRDLVVFVAYAVILITLVVPGLTLAPLLRALGLVESEDDRRASAQARVRITEAALERLEELADDAPEHVVQRMRDRYGARLERLEARVEGDEDEHGKTDVAVAGRLMAEMIDAEREVLQGDALRERLPRGAAEGDRARARPRRVPPALADPALTRWWRARRHPRVR